MASCAINSLFFYTVLCLSLYKVATLKCSPGTFLYPVLHSGQEFCIECPDGTFISYSDHRQTNCIPCENIREPELESLVSPCNKTHNTVIHCVDGYYRDQTRNPRETGQCKKCTQCQFPGQPCSTYKDTLCCQGENYDVVYNHGVPECKERPWFCRRGQYFDTRGYYCLPCPDNTFMPLDYHIEPECWKCREYHRYDSYRPLHSVIIELCSKTQGPIIGCKDGFFRNPAMGYRDNAIGCSPCTNCSTTDVRYEGRKCDNNDDTVCCSQANMTVVDTPNGPVCCPEASMKVIGTSDGPICCPEANMTVVDTSDGPICCPEANMTVVDTSDGPICCPEANMTVVDTSDGPICCPEANMTVVGTSDGPVCTVPSASCGERQCLQYEVRRRSRSCAPCSQSNSAKDLNNTLGLPLNEPSAIVQTSDAAFSVVLTFSGILTATAVISLIVCVILIWTHRSHRLPTLQYRQLSTGGCVHLEMEEPAETAPLQWTSDNTARDIQSDLRSTVFNDGTEHQETSFGDCSAHLTKNDDHKHEQCCGDESDLHGKKKMCRNASNHTKLIGVMELTLELLPRMYCRFGKMDYIKSVCDLTVRLKVNYTSNGRPKGYPCSELGGATGAGIKRFGTGLVYQVRKRFTETSKSSTVCPCRFCYVNPSEAKSNWTEFAVVTAAQIVYDDSECCRTSCRLWFNQDDNFVQAPSLKGKCVEKFVENQDYRIMYCVTHEEKIGQNLERMVAHFDDLRGKHKYTAEDDIDDKRLAVLISHQHGLSKKLVYGNATVKNEHGKQKWSYDTRSCPGSYGAPVCLLGKSQGSGILTAINSMDNESTQFYL